MHHMRSVLAVALMAAVAGLWPFTAAAVEVKVEFDKTFDFRTVRTWGWNPAGAGEVKMARTVDDDPEAMKRLAEPWILDAVATEMTRAGLTRSDSAPNVTVTYYLLLSTSMSSQSVGEFLPAVTAWALPPFAPATQSLRMMNRGSLVLDLTAGSAVVWRGLAQTQLKPDTARAKKESVLREGVRDLLRRYPSRS
jgi:hypothetical protein